MTEVEEKTLLLKISLVVVLIGFLDSLYLYYMELTGNFNCLIDQGSFNCQTVNTSVYSKFLGVDVSLWGLIFYFIVMILLYLAIKNVKGYWLSFFLPVAGLWAFAFSIYLTAIEAFVIRYYCEFCILSAICNAAFFILIILSKYQNFPSLFSQLDFWKVFSKEDKIAK